MVAADGVVTRCQGAGGGGRQQVGQVIRRIREVEGESHAGEHVEKVRVSGCDAGGVEKSGDGADGAGGCRVVGGVAGVVLGASANGNVLEYQVGRNAWESCGCYFCLLVSLARFDNGRGRGSGLQSTGI